MDGWGLGKKDFSDAIQQAKTPFVDSLFENLPNGTLITHGENVGLPKGQMGNSEVGHMNIGAGRIVYQMLARINKSFEDKTFKQKLLWKSIIKELKNEPKKKIHLMGLLSDGGVHSHQSHLHNLLALLKEEELDKQTLIHAFTDGRDTAPKSGLDFVAKLLKNKNIGQSRLATICGRYYAMDRDNRWERTEKAYRLIAHGEGEIFNDPLKAIKSRYQKGETDEFLKPISLNMHNSNYKLSEGDVVICFNFRTDRARQITQALTQESFGEFEIKQVKTSYFTFTEYDKNFKNISVFFEKEDLKNTLGEVLSSHKKSQIRAAETEKYPHVTFFLSGGREIAFPFEERILTNSPKVATYDLQPEMSAQRLTKLVLKKLHELPDFVCLNYANPDMVGHTGVYDAIVKAIEVVDSCLKEIVEQGTKLGYQFFITADHGNAEKTKNEDGSPNTSHTTNLVPYFVMSSKVKKIASQGILADIAPTILHLLNIPMPEEMNGKSLVQ